MILFRIAIQHWVLVSLLAVGLEFRFFDFTSFKWKAWQFCQEVWFNCYHCPIGSQSLSHQCDSEGTPEAHADLLTRSVENGGVLFRSLTCFCFCFLLLLCWVIKLVRHGNHFIDTCCSSYSKSDCNTTFDYVQDMCCTQCVTGWLYTDYWGDHLIEDNVFCKALPECYACPGSVDSAFSTFPCNKLIARALYGIAGNFQWNFCSFL